MRSRIWIIALAASAVIAAFVVLYEWRTAGEAETRTATDRIAAALARGDQAALAGEPFLQNHPEIVAWLVQRGSALADGYRVKVRRNGENGHTLLSRDDISHLGVIETPSGTVTLGFQHDPETGHLKFVTASYSSIG